MQFNALTSAPTAPTADEAGPQDDVVTPPPPAAPEVVPTPGPEASYHPAPAPARDRRRRWPLWAAAAAFLLLGTAAVGSYAYASHYSGLALPGTTVAGTDVSGMSRQQIVDLVSSKADAVTVKVSGDASATASLTDLGVTVDAEAVADAALKPSASFGSRLAGLFSDHPVTVATTTQEDTAATYASSLIPSDKAAAHNAGVTLGEDDETFEVSPGSEGVSIDASTLRTAAEQAATSLTSTDVSVSFVTAPPKVSDADAQAVADKANSWVSQDVTITATTTTGSGDQKKTEEESFTADASTKASWITVSQSGDNPPTLGVDSAKVTTWVNEQADEVNAEPVKGQRNVNSRGEVVATAVEAKDGTTVSNSADVASAITNALGSGKAYTGSFTTKTIEATWEERKIADGAENLVYPAAVGEKWIDINLSNKTVTAYEGATVVRGPVSIVDGAPETPTVTGTYHIYLQNATQTMRGQNADGTPYEAEGIPWISYFYEGYALHGAPSRSSFGFSGSHGCLNMPVGEAKWIYDWATIGTTVVSHY